MQTRGLKEGDQGPGNFAGGRDKSGEKNPNTRARIWSCFLLSSRHPWELKEAEAEAWDISEHLWVGGC